MDQESLAKLDAAMTALASLGMLHGMAKDEYARLVELPYGSWERVYASRSLPFLRDFIATYEDRSAEDVQTEYEAKAAPVHAMRNGNSSFSSAKFNG